MNKEKPNSLAVAVDITESKARLDTNVKLLLSHKPILAWILKNVCHEMSAYSIEEIEDLIEGEPDVGIIPALPGATNSTSHSISKIEQIRGDNTESNIPNEGYITFDILFRVAVPGSMQLELIINLEAQKNFYPGYPLVKRGIFYASREISSQMNRDFSHPHYEDIKKVYSIWICPEAPENFISSYSMQPKALIGRCKYGAEHDIIQVIIVGLNENQNSTSDFIEMMNTLFSHKKSSIEKKKILSNNYKIPMTNVLEKEIDKMCNYSDLVEERGIQRGLEQGLAQGLEQGTQKMQKMVFSFVQRGMISPDVGAEELSLTLEELTKKMTENGYQIP